MRLVKELIMAAMFPVMCLAILKYPELFSLNWKWVFFTMGLNAVSQLVIGLVVTAVSLSRNGLEGILKQTCSEIGNQKDSAMNSMEYHATVAKYTNLAVAATKGLEDILFVLPLMFVHGYLVIPAVIVSAVIFSTYHDHLPIDRRIILLAYVPIAYLVAINYGLLTVIFAHGLFDFTIYAFRKVVIHLAEKACSKAVSDLQTTSDKVVQTTSDKVVGEIERLFR